MKNMTKQRLKLEQKKAKIITVEAKLKIQERKARTRHLIQIGGLIAKAKLDNLPTNTLFGALLSLKNELVKYPSNQDQWTKISKSAFDSSNS